MKKINCILKIVMLFFSLTIAAQNNYGRNDNRNNTTPNIDTENERFKEDFEKQKAKNIEKSIEKLKTDLQLDALQEIAIKQIIMESIRNEGIIMKKEENEEDKIKAMKALSESTDLKITALLNPVQKEKFIELKTNLKKKKK